MISALSPGVGLSPRRGLRVSFKCDVASTNMIRPLSLEDDEPVVEKPAPPLVLEARLENEVSKQVVQQHRSSLRQLALKQRDCLTVVSNHTNNSSLRSILSAGIMDHDRSSLNNKNSKKWYGIELENNSTTEITEDLTEFSYSGDYPNVFADFESDQQTWGSITGYNFDGEDDEEKEDAVEGNDSSSFEVPQAAKTHSCSSSSSNEDSSICNNIQSEIEVTPGVFVPLRGSTETWQAIKSGCTVSTHCSSCNAKLHVIEDAALVVCQDCWMVSPVTQRLGDILMEFDGEDNECTTYGVGLGVKGEDVLQWIKQGNDVSGDNAILESS